VKRKQPVPVTFGKGPHFSPFLTTKRPRHPVETINASGKEYISYVDVSFYGQDSLSGEGVYMGFYRRWYRVCKWRIPKELVLSIFKQPDKVIEQDEAVTIYDKLVVEGSKPYLYRVFVNFLKKPVTIITVYKTSKIEKYGYKI
jgi:hypothetical protein